MGKFCGKVEPWPGDLVEASGNNFKSFCGIRPGCGANVESVGLRDSDGSWDSR